LAELEVLKYLASFPYWQVGKIPIAYSHNSGQRNAAMRAQL